MYTVIRKYDLVPNTSEEFLRDVQESLIPIIKRMPGLREFSVVEVAENELVTISVFDSLTDAKASARQTVEWVAKHTESFFQGFSKAMTGPIKVHSGPSCMPQSNQEELLRGVF